jgi:hypothetical protein
MHLRRAAPPFAVLVIAALAALVPALSPARGATTLNVPGDYPSIQAAVNAASNGDVIVVGLREFGDYEENVLVEGFQSLTLRGKRKPAINPQGPGYCLTIRGCKNVTVVDFYLINSTTGGLQVEKSDNVYVAKLDIGGNGGHNVELADCKNFTITKCHLFSSVGCCIKDTFSDGVNIVKNTFEIAIEDAINLSANRPDPGTTKVLISGNRIRLAHGRAITVGGSHIRIEKNRIWDSLTAIGGGSGISLDASATTTNAVVEKNKLWDLKGRGIFVSGDGNRVLKNKLTNVGVDEDAGVRVVGENHHLEGNKIAGTDDEGFALDCSMCTFVKNKVAGTAGHGFDLFGDDNVFYGNKVVGAGADGFRLDGKGNDLTKNKAAGSEGFDLNDLAPLGDNTYTKNKFGTVQQAPP